MSDTPSRGNSGAQRLSAAIIVRDDADGLAATLGSIVGMADEVVVLDTGSSDDSRDVARRAGALLFEAPWNDDFSAARNACLEQVSGDWVLWLDAGETLAPDAALQLRRFVAEQADPRRAYMLLVVTAAGPEGQAAEQVGRIRLLPNAPGLRFAGRVRETPAAALAEQGIEIEGLPMRIARGPRDHETDWKLRRANRDVTLAQLEVEQSGADPRLLLALGEALRNQGRRPVSHRMFSHALQRAVGGGSEMLEAYYGVLTTLEEKTSVETLDRQIATCLEALEIYPLDSQLLCAMGGFLAQKGNVELAVRAFETALEHGQVNPTVCHLTEIHVIAALCAASLMASRGERDKAIATLERSLAENRNHRGLQSRIAELRSGVEPTEPATAGLRRTDLQAPSGLTPPLGSTWLKAAQASQVSR